MHVMICVEVVCDDRDNKKHLCFQKVSPVLPPGIVWQVGMKYWDDCDTFDDSLRTVQEIEVNKDCVCVIFQSTRYDLAEYAKNDFTSQGWIEVAGF